MKIEEKNGLRILTPDNPENWLTNGETYSQLVYLGKNDSPDNWREITAEEYADATRPESDEPEFREFIKGLSEGYGVI